MGLIADAEGPEELIAASFEGDVFALPKGCYTARLRPDDYEKDKHRNDSASLFD